MLVFDILNDLTFLSRLLKSKLLFSRCHSNTDLRLSTYILQSTVKHQAGVLFLPPRVLSAEARKQRSTGGWNVFLCCKKTCINPI